MFEYLVSSWWSCLGRLRGVALLEEVCHWGWVWRSIWLKPISHILSASCLWLEDELPAVPDAMDTVYCDDSLP